MMPNSPCSGANDTEAPPTRVRPGDSRRSSWLSYFDGMPYGLVATGSPRLVAQGGKLRISGSPSTAALAVSGAASAAPAARKLFLRKSRRPLPTAVICSSDRKFSGAGRRRPGFLTMSPIWINPSDLLNVSTAIRRRNTQLVTQIAAGHRDADRSADVDEIRIDDPIEDRAAIPPPVDHAGPVQDVEMPRDVGLGQANLFHDLVDGTLFGTKTGENAQTRRVCQQPEVMRHLLEYLQCLVHAVLF